MLPHPLTNFEIQKYCQNEPEYNRVFLSRNYLPKIMDGAYVINLDEFKSIGTDWIVLYVNGNNIIHCDSFTVEHIRKEIKKSIENKNIIVYRIQAYISITFGYFCIGFIDFMLKDKCLLDYTNLFCLNDYEKYDKIILKYFK